MTESMSQSPEFDPKSPYYIEPDYDSEENMPMVILSQPDDNYFIWKNHFLDFLVSKGKTGFVDGSVVVPDPSSPLYGPWKTCNARVMCWMMNSVGKNLRDYVLYAKTAYKAWEDLRMMFVLSIDLKIYELRLRIATFRQDGDSVPRYFSKLMTAWNELSEYDPLPECACGGCRCEIKKRAEDAREKEQRYVFLMGLNERLSYMRTQIMIMDPPPSLDKAFAMVQRAESMMK